jgi:glyoxylase-like metal-dependent hydrolase (beta-lactamase superfamily II)
MRQDPVLVSAENPGPMTGAGNNTWLIDGAVPTLIDAGVGMTGHVASIARLLASRALVRVLVTHGHPDHASGIPALRTSWSSLEACKFLLHGESGWRALVDGEAVQAGDRTLTVVHTPGHAADHVCFWDADRGDLFAGDMVLADTTVMIPAGRGGNLRQYLQSLEKLAALKPGRIYPGHGSVISDPLAVISRYLEHRKAREEQILDCLASGLAQIDEIVDRMYPNVPDPLRRAATLTVEAHLEKLRDDGRIS